MFYSNLLLYVFAGILAIGIAYLVVLYFKYLYCFESNFGFKKKPNGEMDQYDCLLIENHFFRFCRAPEVHENIVKFSRHLRWCGYRFNPLMLLIWHLRWFGYRLATDSDYVKFYERCPDKAMGYDQASKTFLRIESLGASRGIQRLSRRPDDFWTGTIAITKINQIPLSLPLGRTMEAGAP